MKPLLYLSEHNLSRLMFSDILLFKYNQTEILNLFYIRDSGIHTNQRIQWKTKTTAVIVFLYSKN